MGSRLPTAVAVVLALVGLSACRYLDPFSRYVRTVDIVYGAGINEDGQLEDRLLDLYLPKDDTATNRPVVIWAHGGGFRQGDKVGLTNWVRQYAMRGYVGASINYRMGEDGGPITYPLDA